MQGQSSRLCAACGETRKIFARTVCANCYYRLYRVPRKATLPPEVLQRQLAYRAAWAQQHPDRIAKTQASYRERNRAKTRAATARWAATHPEATRAIVQRRRARLRGLPATLTPDQWEHLKAAYGHRCAYCGRRAKLTQDHVVPLAKGGAYAISNIVPACGPCNNRKYTGNPPVPVRLMLL